MEPKCEIRVTPAMIAAAVEIFKENWVYVRDLDDGIMEQFPRLIYEAMERVRIESAS
jgi:hypothetical protein